MISHYFKNIVYANFIFNKYKSILLFSYKFSKLNFYISYIPSEYWELPGFMDLFLYSCIVSEIIPRLVTK
jgi:hypothetical protein